LGIVDTLTAFRAQYPFALDDYQVSACGHVAAGRGVLVAAPTGAGKTVVGEFAVFLALATGRKCFYTTPIKALSNQKFHDLCERHGEERVGLLTGDTTLNPDAPVVVMTTEVLRNMLYAGSSTLTNLGFVVMDEVHYLADRFRGAVWEEVIISLAESVQLVALSATVSNAEEFGAWLSEVRGGVEVVVTERRPVPLYQHVMAGRRLLELFAGEDVNPELLRMAKEDSRSQRDDSRRPRGRSGNGRRSTAYGSGRYGGAAARERLDEGRRLVPRRDATIERLAAEGLLPAIYFIFSRQGCDTAVGQLANSGLRLTSGAERRELAAIAARHTVGLSPSDLEALEYDRFLAAFTDGVAAHHAGLLPAFKEMVEEAFAAGLVKVVFATETLALGINMPARSVVLEKLVKYNGETHADITAGEYTQLTGRAGRRGIDVEGHAVVCWQPGLDPRAVAGLASRRTYPLRSSFQPTYNMAVNLVATVGREHARGLLEQSFAQYQSDRSVVGLAHSIAANRARVAQEWASAACERGDAEAYFRLRSRIAAVEARAARERRADRRAESIDALRELRPGDILDVPGKRHRNWAVVIDPGVGPDGPTPTVLTVDRQVKRLSVVDFPTPPVVAARMKVPKHFDARSAVFRRNLAAALDARLRRDPPSAGPAQTDLADADAMARVAELRLELRAQPVHSCPDREVHARHAEAALRLERDTEAAQRQADRRTNTIAVRFDRICSVLESLGYLSPDGGQRVTDQGRMLARIYSELDLVTAEAVRDGVFDGLAAPQLAAVVSSLVYEARGDRRNPARMPDRRSEDAQIRLRSIWRQVSLSERDHRLPSHDEPDIGFAEAIHAWTAGAELADVLYLSGLTAGDFVRWARQVLDAAGQLADAVGPGPLRDTCRELVFRVRRGVVDAAPLED
jgi:ATP-dependent RNA helicase HelY